MRSGYYVDTCLDIQKAKDIEKVKEGFKKSIFRQKR
jgi:hypothetical protein